jgi:hypothetical protein
MTARNCTLPSIIAAIESQQVREDKTWDKRKEMTKCFVAPFQGEFFHQIIDAMQVRKGNGILGIRVAWPLG